MPVNRRRHANAIPLASFATWAIIGLFACCAGLGYVWYKNQLYVTGAKIKKLEVELAQLRSRNEVARVNIAKNISTRKLQERYDSGFIKLIPITNDHVVTVTQTPQALGRDELRPVSNERLQE